LTQTSSTKALRRLTDVISYPSALQLEGRIASVRGRCLTVDGLGGLIGIGETLETGGASGNVISLMGGAAMVMMDERTEGMRVGQVVRHASRATLRPSSDWLGRCLDYNGRDEKGVLPKGGPIALDLQSLPPPAPLRRALGARITTGVAALDSFLPVCRGQRLGLFAGSGVGKSTLLGHIARNGTADVNVLALIGERGREVRHFIEHVLGPKGMAKTVLFVATSDCAASVKLRTARLAMATAEVFRNEGQHVLLMLDSLTRFADAHRDVALHAGEVPSLRAFPPSTFQILSEFCERAGPGSDGMGDISAIFSVLVAGSNMEEPIADAVRGILDGHIILDRAIAEAGRYPAIDILKSVSRSLPDAANADENSVLVRARRLLSHYEDNRMLIRAGMTVEGADAKLDEAIAKHPALTKFLRRMGTESPEQRIEELAHILDDADPVD